MIVMIGARAKSQMERMGQMAAREETWSVLAVGAHDLPGHRFCLYVHTFSYLYIMISWKLTCNDVFSDHGKESPQSLAFFSFRSEAFESGWLPL
jgi:hypothetical protein